MCVHIGQVTNVRCINTDPAELKRVCGRSSISKQAFGDKRLSMESDIEQVIPDKSDRSGGMTFGRRYSQLFIMYEDLPMLLTPAVPCMVLVRYTARSKCSTGLYHSSVISLSSSSIISSNTIAPRSPDCSSPPASTIF